MKYEVLHPMSYMGTRLERGELVELTDEQAANYTAELVRPVEETKEEKAAESTEKTTEKRQHRKKGLHARP